MPDLSIKYMNLSMKNPLIVSSSGLTKSLEKMQSAEKAGAGAVVIKSLFEEVLAGADLGLHDSLNMHTEAYDYLRSELEMQYGPKEYCDLINQAKNSLSIPVIASINCNSDKWWPSFALQAQEAGADALELNVFKTATGLNDTALSLEQMYARIVGLVKSKLGIPVALKIGHYFTALPAFLAELSKEGLDGVVLFNRFTEPDIDIDKLELRTTFEFSSQYEMYRTLRWTALVSGLIKSDVSASGGVKTYQDVIKLLLAGASTVQLASLLYEKGLDVIQPMLTGINDWMESKGFNSVNDFKGMLNFAKSGSPDVYLRSQFMEKIRGVE